ncbi:MAG: MFS transporter [Clostridiaceae bacterium]|jgi:OPA family glycerol-3-phosphate transporter-like MFS transporter|nr:MFS transporter [Clostridiaceae bacterium]
MNVKIAKDKRTLLFTSLCCLVYFSSYMTRINYGAAVAEIILSLGITKAMASMAVTGSFITYGAGQIFSGVVGDHIKPKTMIFFGLLVTSLCNAVMSTLSNVYVMTVIWCINGFAQSMLWPPLTRIMSENLSADEYRKTCTAVSVSASAATISIYLIVPLCITLSGWRSVFILSAAFAVVSGLVWVFSVDKLTVASQESNEERNAKPALSFGHFLTFVLRSGLLPVVTVIFLHGILRDGITTWMPSYINDIYRFGTSLSILNTAILPVFSSISFLIASRLFQAVKNEVKASAILWIVGLFCSFLLIFVYKSQAVVSVLMMAILTGCMHGINLLLIGVFPARFKNSGRVSSASGILNAFTYGGSALSSYGIAALSDHFGWQITIITWCAIALLGTVLSFISVKKT